MTDMSSADEIWPRLLSLAVHELRTPATVVAGYLRLVLKGRAGPVAEPQRQMLEEAEKSCARISALLAEMSDLAHLELGDAAVQNQRADLLAILREVVDEAATGTDVPAVKFDGDGEPVMLEGDVARLKRALAAVLRAVQRELPLEASVVVRQSSRPGSTVVTVSTPDTAAALASATDDRFDELRGGMGLALPLARQVINRHGGRLAVLEDRPRAGVAVIFPTE